MKFDASIGDRRIYLELEGINLERQRDALHTLVQTFFEDLDEEIGIEKEVEVEHQEIAAAEAVIAEVIEEEVNSEPEEEPTIGTFSMAEIIKNYNHDIWELETRPVDMPEELQKAITNGINERNYKLTDNNIAMYQAYYICTGCNHKGKRFIPIGRKSLTCHSCSKRMLVRPALDREWPHNDAYGNMYISGKFMRLEERQLSIEEQEKLKKKNDIYLG